MLQQLLSLWQICLFKRGPQQLKPGWQPLFQILVLDFVLSWFYVASNIDAAWQQAFIPVVVGQAAIILVVVFFIWFKNLIARLPQTLTAILGVDAIFTLLALLISLIFSEASRAIQFIQVALLIWNLSVQGWILHHALSVSTLLGTALALMLMIIISVTQAYLASGL